MSDPSEIDCAEEGTNGFTERTRDEIDESPASVPSEIVEQRASRLVSSSSISASSAGIAPIVELASNSSTVNDSSTSSLGIATLSATSQITKDNGPLSDSSNTTDPEAYQPARASRRSARGKGDKASKKAKKLALREKEKKVEMTQQRASAAAPSSAGVGSASALASGSSSVVGHLQVPNTYGGPTDPTGSCACSTPFRYVC